ncbi:MAG TPA: tripartite tricarboxylate transporter substrate-binding protein [Xanthobacteraceae bacterium]|jgi:tripartite-type tricarboxylate transporter receptor subunit TctC|nr:tripartite tricarboxylate transporter substrate-binding protein [Xanthobacteraceae bacterium]
MPKRRSSLFVLALALMAAVAPTVSAQDLPGGPARIYVPFAPGGPTDVLARILADLLSTRWGGRSVLVENRPGAGTIVATAALAKAPPDGSTFMLATNSFLINPALNLKLPYDTVRDFVPVSMIATQPIALVASKSFQADTLAELIALARQAPESLNYTSPGPRTATHLAGEMLQQRAGFRMTHINYNGSAPALTDVIAGRVPLMLDVWHSARRYVESGDLKLIAGAGLDPLPGAAGTPTIAATFPGFNVIAFNAAIGPAGIPGPVLEKLSADIRTVVDSRAFAERTANLGIDAKGNTPAELEAWMRQEIDKWVRIVREANIKGE